MSEGQDPAKAFLARLPPRYREAELYALSSEDHYLRVHTSLGQELVLLRLSDAVRGRRRQGGKTSLLLPDGSLVPVSRTFVADVRAAGLTD